MHPQARASEGADARAAANAAEVAAREQATEARTEPATEPSAEPVTEPDAEPSAETALQEQLRRALADLDNLRKRHARERERERLAEAKRVAAAWLPVLDNLDLALSYAEADPAVIIEGVRRVRDQALDVLANLGYPRHDEVGVPFDPHQHEVVSIVDDPDSAPGTVVQVVRPGYGDAERQLRPGAVAVAGRQG